MSLLDQLPSSLWAVSSTDIGRIHSVPPIKIQIDLSKSLPRINQYPISEKVHQGIKPVTDYIAQALLFLTRVPPILPVRNPKSRGWRSVQVL